LALLAVSRQRLFANDNLTLPGELALAAMQQVVGQNVANMAMASGCAPRDLAEIQIINRRSWFGSSHTTTIRFRR